jgi:hypothetical protein
MSNETLKSELAEAREKAVAIAEEGTIHGLESSGLVVVPIRLLRQLQHQITETELRPNSWRPHES